VENRLAFGRRAHQDQEKKTGAGQMARARK
jgi:hypothetical protein